MISAKQLLPRGLRRAILPLIVLALLPTTASQAAVPPAPALTVASLSSPTRFVPGDASGTALYAITVTNIGAKKTDGSPITITDTLPAGVSLDPAAEFPNLRIFDDREEWYNEELFSCEAGPPVTCTAHASTLQPGMTLTMYVPVDIAPSASGVAVNQVDVSVDGTPTLSTTESTLLSPELAGFGFQGLNTSITDEQGGVFTQAGGHPYQFHTDFQLNTVFNPGAGNPPAGTPKNLSVKLPLGMVVNPNATPERCTEAEFEASLETDCPDGSAVGLVHSTVNAAGFSTSATAAPLYNLVPPPGVPAAFGFNPVGLGIFVHIFGGVDSAGDYALVASAKDIPQYGNFSGVKVDLWGNPTDPSHDYRRGVCAFVSSAVEGRSCSTEPVDTALLTMPSACSADPLTTTVTTDSWEEPGSSITGSSSTRDSAGNPIGVEGCEQLKFEPTISSRPTTNLSDSPTGLNFNLHQPQSEDYEGLATATLKDAKITLPVGMNLNASAGNGLGACSLAQIGYQPKEGEIHFSDQPQSCPNAAKIGTLEVSTPVLENKLPGAVYVAKPFENPFGSLLAIYLVVEDKATGIIVKLAGKAIPDPQTGQLTTVFRDNPPLPIEDFDVHFFDGPRAALKTPLPCASFTATADLTPWSTPAGANKVTTDSFATSVAASGSGACPATEAQAPNNPLFSAGTIVPKAGAYSPFLLKLFRPDGSQRLTGLETTLPKGLTGKLAGIPYCSEGQIAQAKSREAPNQGAIEQASPSCPLASEVGTVTVGAGAGSAPLYVPGHAYLAGPYRGAPLSLVIITPALAGPFDLGAVTVRTALYVNSETAQIRAVSDPLPTILQGIPLELRSVALRMDRPSFVLNPTSCDPKTVVGSMMAATGQSAALGSPFQVGECRALRFAPKLALSLKGGTRRTKHPALRAVLTYPKGHYANIVKAQVTLPHSEFLDSTHIGTVCTRVQFAADTCPKASVYGFARAFTPLLDKPVEGPVYLRSSNHELPDVVAALDGQVDVDLVGRVDTGKNDGIRNTFEAVPDAPVSKFVLEMKGGKKGLLINSENICSKPQRAVADFKAQNGRVSKLTPLIANSCGKKSSKAKRGSGSK